MTRARFVCALLGVICLLAVEVAWNRWRARG
jgi:hypothetical protein